ncbi:UNVERIFIED_CONTAM: putative peptidyl-tRNA hydrolase PTRHD1 [Sesamum calycinum]|uniref:peptidyl-tRNA hydrolase n=1 Tax=Sesamum calycinum TaxID=2727403 RepID=A0AAW2M0A3_9LAMI
MTVVNLKLFSSSEVTLEVKGEAQILNLADKLKASGIAHKLWIEQPENIPTCLATKPYPKSSVSSFFKKLSSRHKAEPPVTLHVQGLDHAPAVGARPRRLLPPDHPLIFVAYEHQHIFSLNQLETIGAFKGLICLAEFLLADRIKSP